MAENHQSPAVSIAGLFSWVVRLAAVSGTLGVVFVHAWSFASPEAEWTPLLLFAFAAIVGASYLHWAAVGGLLVAVMAAVRKQRVSGVIAGLGVGLAVGPTLLGTVGSWLQIADHDGRPELTVYSANLLNGRGDVDVLVADIRGIDPDVILLQETTPALEAAVLERLEDAYPHVVRAPRDDAFGQTVLSRLAFTRSPVVYPSTGVVPRRGWVPQIGVWVEVPSVFVVSDPGPPAEVEIWNVHVFPPVGLGFVRDQDRMGRGLLEVVERSTADAVVLAGDFNCSEDGPIVRRFTNRGFQSAHRSLGGVAGWTWPARRLPLLRTRLDHVLVRGRGGIDAEFVEQGRGEANGSDHLPVWATIDLSRTR